MGEISERRIRTAHRVLLIGQAPGADGDARPLTGTMGVRLASLMGLLPGHPDRRWKPTDGAGAAPGSTLGPEAKMEDVLGLYFDRANVLDHFPGRKGKGHAFPLGHARAAAALMWPRVLEYERVVFCGMAVKDAFKDAACGSADHAIRRRLRHEWSWWPPFHWDGSFGPSLAWLPHTSGIVTAWNDPEFVERARLFLSDLAEWTTWGRTRAEALSA